MGEKAAERVRVAGPRGGIGPQEKTNGEQTVKNTVKAIIECAAVACGLFLIIHRRVFAACLTGDPMPEMPEWHKKLFGCAMPEPENENTEEEET